MLRFTIFILAVVLSTSSLPDSALAYIGPGAGISAIGSVLALLAAVLLAIVGFVWYPMKRFRKNRNKARAKAAEKEKEQASH